MKRKLNEDWAETDTIVVVLAEKEYKTPNWGLSIPEHCALCDVRLGGFLWWPRDEVHLVCFDCYNRWATEQDDHFSYSTLAPNCPATGICWSRSPRCLSRPHVSG